MTSMQRPLKKRPMCLGSLFVVLMAISPVAVANSYNLKCTSQTGKTFGATVDLDHKIMTWGKIPWNYTITNINDRDITSIENNDIMRRNVGSEVIVLDLVTGEYVGASVGMYCKNESCGTGTDLEAHTYSGKCLK